jgi:energy-coupling factor transport system ATP-binding protein
MCSINNARQWGVKNLRLAFPKKRQMFFKDLNFCYGTGERVLLLGPSGCGKSTLLQVLSGLVPGSIELPMKAASVAIPQSWGFIFQDPDTQFCMPYADEEIAFVLENRGIDRRQMPELIRRYLQMTGLNADHPHRLIRTLSGGMKQRLAIASVLALEPDVLFLDEPTALLDPEGTKQLWQTVRAISDRRTLIIVEHKIDRVLDFIKRIVLFDSSGRIIADGAKEEILGAHREAIDRYGIWHPGAWPGYLKKRTGRPTPRPSGQPLLELNRFAAFHGKKKCFQTEHLTIHRGEWVAVIGENGAGKSTMIEGLMKLIPHSGQIKWSLDRPEDQVAFVFQNPEYQFVTDRVKDELGFSLVLKKIAPALIARRVAGALKRYGLTGRQEQSPYQLSVGEKRRLSVASSLIDRPQAVILDEPTFGQDARNTFALLDLFGDLVMSGTTVIMVTHEMEIVRHFATRILTVENGRLIKDIAPVGKMGREGESSDGRASDGSKQTTFQSQPDF